MTPPDASSHALPFPGARRPAARSGERPDTSGLVAERLRARRQRVTMIRRRVVGIAVALFIALWSGLMLQLVSGSDPGLAKTTRAATVASPTTGSTSGKATASSSTSQASAVTTSQS